jgi:hypothetical protein
VAASTQNEFWSSPLIALALMMILGTFQSHSKEDKFLWFYVALVAGSGALLFFAGEAVYWTTPLVLGVLYRLFIGELVIKTK